VATTIKYMDDYMKDSVVVSIRLPKDLLKRLDARAEQERRPRANMVRLLLEQALKAKG
jgi:metal-responsive CopG/Arc/MetJ family transcriptional regulator